MASSSVFHLSGVRPTPASCRSGADGVCTLPRQQAEYIRASMKTLYIFNPLCVVFLHARPPARHLAWQELRSHPSSSFFHRPLTHEREGHHQARVWVPQSHKHYPRVQKETCCLHSSAVKCEREWTVCVCVCVRYRLPR